MAILGMNGWDTWVVEIVCKQIRLTTVSLFISALIAGCSKQSPEVSTTEPPVAAALPKAPDTAPARINLKQPVLLIETSAGNIKLQLDGAQAPGTVRNFVDYAIGGFYDNTVVHYVDPDKMVVAGGYSVNRQPRSNLRPPIRNEAHNGLKNTRGTIAMTRDPSLIDSATSQFFLNLSDAPQRDHNGQSAADYGYCVFGKVIQGIEVADQISKLPTENAGGDLVQTPKPPVVVKSVRLVD